MNKRPISVTIIGCVYIATGAVGVAFHFLQVKSLHPFQYDVFWAELVSVVAIVCGVYMLRGRNWARWLALAWIAFHVVLSAFHTLPELAVHSLFCAVLAFFLFFHSAATRYFRAAKEKRHRQPEHAAGTGLG